MPRSLAAAPPRMAILVAVAEAGNQEDVIDQDAARPAKASAIGSGEIGISILPALVAG